MSFPFPSLRINTSVSTEPTTTLTANEIATLRKRVDETSDRAELAEISSAIRYSLIPYTNAAAFMNNELERMEYLLTKPEVKIHEIKGIILRNLYMSVPSANVVPALGHSVSRFNFTNMNINNRSRNNRNNRSNRNKHNNRNNKKTLKRPRNRNNSNNGPAAKRKFF